MSKARQNLRKRANALHVLQTDDPDVIAQWRRLRERMGQPTELHKGPGVGYVTLEPRGLR